MSWMRIKPGDPRMIVLDSYPHSNHVDYKFIDFDHEIWIYNPGESEESMVLCHYLGTTASSNYYCFGLLLQD